MVHVKLVRDGAIRGSSPSRKLRLPTAVEARLKPIEERSAACYSEIERTNENRLSLARAIRRLAAGIDED